MHLVSFLHIRELPLMAAKAVKHPRQLRYEVTPVFMCIMHMKIHVHAPEKGACTVHAPFFGLQCFWRLEDGTLPSCTRAAMLSPFSATGDAHILLHLVSLGHWAGSSCPLPSTTSSQLPP